MKNCFVVLAVCLLSGSLFAQAHQSMVVTAVKFSGLNDIPQGVQTDVAERFRGKSFDNANWISELKERTRDACQQSGYFQANAEAKIEPSSEDLSHRQVAVNVIVEEGPQYRLKDIRITKATVFPTDQIRALFQLQPGEVFNTAKIREGLEAARRLYGERGYINFTPIPDTKIDREAQLIEVIMEVDEGPQFHLGRLTVVGPNSDVNDRLMRDWESEVGQTYIPIDLDNFIRNHQSLLSSYYDLPNRVRIKKDEENHVVNIILNLNN